MRDTPSRGKWTLRTLALGCRLPVGEPALVDRDGKGQLALAPIALFRRPSPEAIEELFVLDGAHKKAALFVSLPAIGRAS